MENSVGGWQLTRQIAVKNGVRGQDFAKKQQIIFNIITQVLF